MDMLQCSLSKAGVCQVYLQVYAGTAVLGDQESFVVTPLLELSASVGPLCASTVETSCLGISVLLLPIAPDLLMFLGVAPLTPVSGVRYPISWGQEAKAGN